MPSFKPFDLGSCPIDMYEGYPFNASILQFKHKVPVFWFSVD